MYKTASPVSKEEWIRLSERIKRVDEDRWLSSRYADGLQRRKLMALYAFNYELAKVRTSVSEAALGAIRFQWWRETIEEIASGSPVRRHDVARALAEVGVDIAFLNDLIDRYQDAFEANDRTMEPTGLLAVAAASCIDPAALTAWRRETDLVGGAYGDACRGDVSQHACPSLTIPSPLRPALAHARLIRIYAKEAAPGPLTKRFIILAAMINGRV